MYITKIGDTIGRYLYNIYIYICALILYSITNAIISGFCLDPQSIQTNGLLGSFERFWAMMLHTCGVQWGSKYPNVKSFPQNIITTPETETISTLYVGALDPHVYGADRPRGSKYQAFIRCLVPKAMSGRIF